MLNAVSFEIERYAPQVVDDYRRAAARNDEPGAFSADVDVDVRRVPHRGVRGRGTHVCDRNVLVLVNSGLLALLAQTAKLIVLTTAITDGGSQFHYLDNVPLPPAGITADRALADVLARYLHWPAPEAGGVALPASGADLARIDELYRAMVFFTVAHEYAHAYAHHHAYQGLPASRVAS